MPLICILHLNCVSLQIILLTYLQESYALLNKFELMVAKEDAERVDTLRYTWERLAANAVEVINNLIAVQPNFKGELVENVKIFNVDCDTFYGAYRDVSQ